MSNKTLIDVVKKLPADMTISVSVEHAGVFAELPTDKAIRLLCNRGVKWGLTVRDDGEAYGAYIWCDEGDGIGAYANPPTEDDDGNPIVA